MSTTLNATFAALADPTRRAILASLAAKGEATVLDLAAPFHISLPAVSRHLKVLEQAGLIERSRQAQRRPCRLKPDALERITQWVDHTRAAWESRLDRLEVHVAAMQRQERASSKSSPKPVRKKEQRS